MGHGNNRAAARPGASFQVAGGIICKYRHPFLSGQVHEASPVDEIDVSRALRLNDTFLDAQPLNDSSFQELLVDGSVVVITNHSLAGSLTLQALRTTGLVGTGDLIAAAHLVIASKDDVGGTFTVIETINGKRIVTIFTGVSWKNIPHLRKAGNSVIPYPAVMLYAGWVQGVSANMAVNEKTIWAVGNRTGLKAVYKPYAIQEAENLANFYGGAPISSSIAGVGANNGDSPTGDLVDAAGNPINIAAVPNPLGEGMSGTPAPSTVTWEGAA
jgi:hypothetical protein